MATQGRDGTARDESGTRVGRRGILAVAAAAVAGLAARHVADATPVAAVITDTNFIATGTVTNFDAKGTAAFGMDTSNGTFSTGVSARGSGIGVDAFAPGTSSVGVYASGGAYGVSAFGSSLSGTGVYGNSSAYGVQASASGNGGVGMRGMALGTGSYGVLGITTGAGSVACSGQATGAGSYGVYGTSTTGHGVYGVTAAAGQSSVYGYVTARGAAAISGVAGAGAYAGSFTGPVVVNGDFVAYGGVKSAAVPHGGDGSHRLVYCVEAAEPWLEDFGEGKLVNGRAEIRIDPDFAAVADTGRMHVFLSETGEGSHARVRSKGGQGFVVEANAALLAMQGKKMTDANDTFSYRVVAKRKDIRGERLAKFVLPKTETTAPPVPKAQEPPEPPTPPKRGNGR